MAQGFSFEEAKTPVAPASSGGFSFEEALEAKPTPKREAEPTPRREAVGGGQGTIIPPLAREPQPEYKIVQAPQQPPTATVPPTPTPTVEEPAAPAASERPGLQPFTEFGRGVARAVTADLPSMWKAAGVLKDVSAAGNVQKTITLLDKIDAGEITSSNQLRGKGFTDFPVVQARSYLSATPDIRERMRQQLAGELASRKDLVNASIKTIQAYQEDAKKYRPAVDRPRDIGSVTDFTNWVAGTMGSAAVQFVPMMLAAATTGGVGLGVVSMGMGTAESVLNRAKYIQDQVKNLPPEQQADAIFKYIQSTGDTSLATGIASGALDVVFGPAARLLKLRAGAVPPAATRGEAVRRELKQVPKQMGSEGLTGAAQQAIQTAGAVGLGEKPKFLTRENLLDIAEAGLTEAVGAPIGSAVNVAAAGLRAPAKAEEAPPEAKAEPTFEGIPPTVEPTARAEPVFEEPPLTTEPTARVEPGFSFEDAVGPTAEETTGRVEPGLGEVPRLSRERLFEEEVKDLMATLPVTEEEAKAIVTASMQRAQAKEEQRAAIEPPIFQPTALPATELNAEQTAHLRDLTDEFIAAGNPPEQAAQLALAQVNQEIEADALATTTVKGAEDAGKAVPTPSREGVPVAGEPPAVTPAAGPGGAKPDGVVPVAEDAGQPAAGEAAEPGAVTQKPAKVSFRSPDVGIVYNESVSGGLRRIAEDDDIALEFPAREGAIMLTGIDRQAGGQKGRASDVLKALTTWADQNKERLVLMPSASGDLKQPELIKWYERNGFTQASDGAMERAPTYTPSPAVAARIAELENEQKGLLTKAGKVPAPNSKARVRYDELQTDIDLLKSGDKAEVQLVEQRAMDTQGVEMAKTNAAMAFDQRREYADLQEAIDSYRENVRDTLTDLGIRNQFTEEATLKAFDAEVERLRAAELGATAKERAEKHKAQRPAYGEPQTPERSKFNQWEREQTILDKEAKLEALQGRDESTINWDREWEGDTRVRSLKEARAETNYLKERYGLPESFGLPTPTETKPAAPAKRGRPAVERSEEQKAALEEQRKVTKNAVQKADYTLKKMQAQLDAATKPLDEGAFDTDEALKEAQDAQRADKRAAIRQMLLLDEEPSLRGTAVGKRVKAALKDPRITPTEVADIKRGIEVARKSLGDKSTLLSAFKEGVGPVNRGVSRATTAVQALNAVIRNGSPFQRLLADRLLNFARGVKFVVLEEGQAIPAELQPYVDDWERANGMFVPDLNAIYVRGASFGEAQGVNNITVLHEVLHAATNQKIVLGLLATTRSGYGDSDLQQFVLELVTIMEAAKAAYEVRVENGTVNPEVRKIYARTDGEVFDSPQEFLAYGMSDPDFQLFLMRIRTIKRGVPDESGFSKFVRTIMRTFGFGPGSYSLFSDLINVTDNIISARKTPAMRFAEKTMPSSAPLLQRDQKLAQQEGIRSAKTLAREQKKAELGYKRSKLSNDRKNLSLMQKARDAGLVQRAFRTIYSKADTAAKTALANAVSFDFLARETENTLPPIKAAYQVVQKMIGHIHALQEAGINQIQMLNKDFKADKKLEDKLNEVLYQSTVLQVDPSDPKSLERSKVLDRMYSNLGLEGQKAYQRIIRFHDSLRGYQEYLLNKQIQDLPGLTKEVKDNLLSQIIKRFQDERRIEPYIPLVRDTGEFWLAVGKGDDTQIYIYETREQRNEDAERIAREDYGGKPVGLLLEDGEFGQGNEIKELRGRLDLRGSLLPKLFDAVDEATSSETEAGNKSADTLNKQLKDDIFNIWLSMLPEQSFRRQFTQRKSRPGYRPDIRRNIGSHMARLAPALGRLRYGQELRSEQTRLRELVRVDESLTPFKEAADSRIDFILAPKERGFWDAVAGGANKLTYLTYLTGVITALLQPMSIYISALPILAANHKRNPAMVAKELGKMVVYLKQYGITKKLPDGRIKYTAPTLANNKSLPEDELRAIRAMTSMNVAQQTYAGFLWDVSNADALAISDTGVKGFAAKTADLLVNALMRNSERLTREIVYLASYRLGRQRGLSEEDAIIQAASDVKESLGDYDIGSRPTWMQGPIGRVAFSMKMYPVIVTQQLFGNMYRMLPFLNKEGKVQALTKFSGIMMTAATLAGVYNMPFADLIIQMLTSFLDDIEDEDKPQGLKELDPVTWFKTVWMPDKLGEIKIGGVPLNELIGEGPLVLTGRALGQRIGLNDLWSRDGKPSKNISEAVQAFMLSYFGGPISSYVQSVTKGLDDMAVGDYERAFERIVPLAHARNFMVARRAEKEGYETPRGILVSPEEVTKADLAWQAMGVTPADVAAARDLSFKLTGAQQKVINQRTLLIDRIKFAHRKGDDELSEKLRYEDIPEFNEKYPEFRITWEQVSNILKNMDEQKAKARAGVTVDKKTQRIFEEAVENMEERLERRQEQK